MPMYSNAKFPLMHSKRLSTCDLFEPEYQGMSEKDIQELEKCKTVIEIDDFFGKKICYILLEALSTKETN